MGNIMTFSSFGVSLISEIVIEATTYIFNKIKKEIEENQYNKTNFEFPDPGDECILVMCIRQDLQMKKGKVASHCGHAAVVAYVQGMKFAPNMVERWMRFGAKKITLQVNTEEELIKLEETSKSLNILTSVVRDGGQKQVAHGTRTVIAIGPAPHTLLDNITQHLELY